jgi:hypothetical protein
LVASPKFDAAAIGHADDVEAAFFLGLLPLIDVLQDEVRFLRPVNLQNLGLVGAANHSGGERFLAELALKLCEVVRCHHPVYLFFYFAVDPHFQAFDMNGLAGPFAVARRNQWVFLSHILTQAKFASPTH